MKLFFIMMEKLMRIKKIILSVFTVLLLGTAMSVPVSAAKTTPTPNFGYVDILVNEESGLIFETRTAAVDGRPAGTVFEAETCYSQAFVRFLVLLIKMVMNGFILVSLQMVNLILIFLVNIC